MKNLAMEKLIERMEERICYLKQAEKHFQHKKEKIQKDINELTQRLEVVKTQVQRLFELGILSPLTWEDESDINRYE
jgi:prefoldin subunit 5